MLLNRNRKNSASPGFSTYTFLTLFPHFSFSTASDSSRPCSGQSDTGWHRSQLFPTSYQTAVRPGRGVTRYFLAHRPRQITVSTHTSKHTHTHKHTVNNPTHSTFKINSSQQRANKSHCVEAVYSAQLPPVTPLADTLPLFRVQFHCQRHSHHTHTHSMSLTGQLTLLYFYKCSPTVWIAQYY